MSTEKTEPNNLAATRALWSIAETDDINQVESLLASGADVNARNEHGVTALMRAAEHGRSRVVRTLLENGADPNTSRNDKFTPLLLAAFFGHQEIVRILVEHGADTTAGTRFGTSAEMWASSRTFRDVVHYLQRPHTSGERTGVEEVKDNRLDGWKQPESISLKINGELNFRTPVIELANSERAALTERLALPSPGNVQSRDETAEVQKPTREVAPRSLSGSWFQSLNRSFAVCAVASVLMVATIFTGLALRRKQLLDGTSRSPLKVVIGGSAVGSSAVSSLSNATEATRILASDTPLDKSPLKTVVSANREKQNKSKLPSAHVPVSTDTPDRTSFAKRQNGFTRVGPPLSIPAGSSELLPNNELPAAPPVAKPQPAVSRDALSLKRPVLSTTLMTRPKSSPSSSRVIQWP